MDRILQELMENRARKNKLLGDMLDLTRLEKERVAADVPEAFEKIAVEWQALSQKIEELDEQCEHIEKLALIKDIRTAGLANRKALDAQAHELLLAIQKEQLECNELALQKIEEYKNDLKNVKESNQRLVSYTQPYNPAYEDGIYFDKKK